MLKVGQKAPTFNLPDENGDKYKLSDYAGEWLLVYFYPKDDTPGCTVEACSFRDNLPKFKKLKTKIVGISGDSVERHRKFADKHKLPFTLLADEDRGVIKKYGALAQKSLFGKKYLGIKRTSFLIDPKGRVAVIYEKVKPAIHAEQVLQDLKSLR